MGLQAQPAISEQLLRKVTMASQRFDAAIQNFNQKTNVQNSIMMESFHNMFTPQQQFPAQPMYPPNGLSPDGSSQSSQDLTHSSFIK